MKSKISSLTKYEIKQRVCMAIVKIHNKDTAPVPHSREYFEGLKILTDLVGWSQIYQGDSHECRLGD